MKHKRRILKVEGFRTSTRTRVDNASLLRIKGNWLTRLGFPHGTSVELTALGPGWLDVRVIGAALPPSLPTEPEGCGMDAEARARLGVRL